MSTNLICIQSIPPTSREKNEGSIPGGEPGLCDDATTTLVRFSEKVLNSRGRWFQKTLACR